MELRERVCSNYFTCCFHLFEKQPVTKFPCTSFTGPHNSVLFRGRTWASIVKALTKRCWSIPRREAWAKGKGRYTFNTGGYCPIELSCPHQSSFLRLDFFLIPCVTCNRLLRRFTALLLYLEHGVLALERLWSTELARGQRSDKGISLQQAGRPAPNFYKLG